MAEIELFSKELIRGIQEYFSQKGFQKAIVGLSGSLNSGVVAALAAAALGPRSVFGVAMSSQTSSSKDLDNAEKLAHRLGIPFEVRPIKFLYSTAVREISDNRRAFDSNTLSHLEFRLRTLVLMTLSDSISALVLDSSSQSNSSIVQRDALGGYSPIADLSDARIYDLACYLGLSPRESPVLLKDF